MKNREIITLLKNTDIFRDIPEEVLEKNAGHFKTLHFDNEESIIRKGEIGNSLYIILSGKVKVHDEEVTVANMSTGNYFGEMSTLNSGIRSMSITALEKVEVVCIDQKTFNKILNTQPDVILKIIGGLIQRLREQNTILIDEFRTREEELKYKVQEQTRLYKEQKERAEHSEKFKQQFLANMSHEIRTPMNAVIGMTNLIMNFPLQPKQRFYLEGIKKSGDTLLHIINDILDLSKAESGKMELEHIDFSLHEVIDQVKQILQFKAEEKGLQLSSNVDENIPDTLIGDPVRLNQVLMNLAGNAIKFTLKGCVTINVRIITPVADTLKENLVEKAHAVFLKFEIIDTGIGIPKEKLEDIFESFSQAHSSDTRRFGGTGLGLTISKQFVEMMGSNISVESEEGNGTTFSFEINFPIGSAKQLLKQKTAGEIDGSILNGLKILLAEDNEYNQVVTIDTLMMKANVEIDSAVNGREAIELLEKNTYDVILMDVQMPELDGYEATAKIRAEFSPPKNQTPIIALTASVIKSDLDKCKAAGMNGYVPKPFSASVLISEIAEITGRKKPAPDLLRMETAINHESDSLLHRDLNGFTDLSYLMKFCDGNEQKMKKYISMYLAAVPSFIQEIEKAIFLSGLPQDLENDLKEIARQVHSFRPKLMFMGMNRARTLAEEVEIEILNIGNKKNIYAKLKELIQIIEQSVNDLEQWRS